MTGQQIFTNQQIDLSSIPTAAYIDFLPLEKSYRTILVIGSLVFTGIIAIGLVIVFWQTDVPGWIAISALSFWLLLGVLQLVFIFKGFKCKGYALRERDMTYKKGWLYKKQVTVPFKRIQHVDIKQGVFERAYGLAKLNVYTAGGNTSDLSIPGLILEDAKQYKSYILGVLEADDEEE